MSTRRNGVLPFGKFKAIVNGHGGVWNNNPDIIFTRSCSHYSARLGDSFIVWQLGCGWYYRGTATENIPHY